MFVTVACGIVSGFHSTQSPIMARCCKSEFQARKVFYGAMVAEGIIALIWAFAGCTLLGVDGLVVVATKDSVLVADKSRVQDLKKLLAKLDNSGA